MKRISVSLDEKLAKRVKAIAKIQDVAVAELVRKSLESYLSGFSTSPRRLGKLPVFKLGKPRKRDLRKAIYQDRSEVASG